MDKFNVIDVAPDLNSLELDMQNWTLLPHKIRLKSNDDCIRMHGCTVYDFYNKQKLGFMQKDNVDTSSNLVNEDTSMLMDNIEEKLNTSRMCQEDPLIVIIDPVDDKDTVISKYQRFDQLSKKFRALSNAYSYSIYGLNLINMYHYMVNKLDDNMEDYENNIKFVSESSNIFDISYDYINKAYKDRDILTIGKYLQEYAEYNIPESVVEEAVVYGGYNKMVSSWYTPLQIMTEFRLPVHEDVFLRPNLYRFTTRGAYLSYAVEPTKENMDTLLSLGWNYNVPINPESVDISNKRNDKHYRDTSIYDITSLMEDVQDIPKMNTNNKLLPVFIVFCNGKVYISFSSKLTDVIEFTGTEFKRVSGIMAFRDLSISGGEFTVYLTFVTDTICKYVDSVVRDRLSDGNVLRSKSDLTRLLNYELRPSDDEIQYYTSVIESILGALVYTAYPDDENIDLSSNSTRTIYKVYSGKVSDYNSTRIDTYIEVLYTELKDILMNKGITNESVLNKLINRLTPRSII